MRPDFGITGCLRDPETQEITHVKARPYLTIRPGPATIYPREVVVRGLAAGQRWAWMGEEPQLVKLVEIKGRRYLRLDGERIPADALEDAPVTPAPSPSAPALG